MNRGRVADYINKEKKDQTRQIKTWDWTIKKKIRLWCLQIFFSQRPAFPSHPIYVCVPWLIWSSLQPLDTTYTHRKTLGRVRGHSSQGHMVGSVPWEGFEGIRVMVTWWRVCLVCILELLAWIDIKWRLNTYYSWCLLAPRRSIED